ncbi:hypothetical protein KY290_010845 [Solanum tuberosum]|uniref:Uncharacterized protein n=1 Tax=Solanum tuberosum TaxID=4113 RepID=A0ABQ7VYW6_SOLTU|nr:hypothetical protein KY290_010845 [Solanum tuberosum]
MSTEEMKKIMVQQARGNANMDKIDANLRKNQLATQDLEKRVGQFSSAQNSCPQGIFLGILRYEKDVKEIVANMRSPIEYEIVGLTEECSSLIQNKLPTKLNDLDVATGHLKMRAHDKVYMLDLYGALKLSYVYKELLSRPKGTP